MPTDSRKLSELSDVTVGFVGTMAPYYRDTGIPFLRTKNIRAGHIDRRDMAWIDDEFNSRIKKSSLREGDVVVARTGTPGVAAVIPRDLSGSNCSDMVIVRPGPELDPRWFSYYMNSLAKGWVRATTVGAVQQHFNVASAQEMSILLPTLETQHAIAEVLGALDDKIAANRRIIDASEELQLALFRRISRTGEHLRLGEMIRLMYGKALPQDMRVPGEVAVVGSGGVVGSHTEGLVSGPAVVVGRKGSVGTVHWIDRDAYPIDTTFWVEPIDELPLPYLHRLLESLPLNSMSSDSAVPGLNREHAYSLLLPAHDREDINRFARDVEGLIARSSLAARENKVLASTRDELLPLLMSGRITVGAASSRVEEVV